MTMLYQRGDVCVDSHFARFGGKSFAINKINSVEVRSKKIPDSQGWVLAGIFGVLILLPSISSFAPLGILAGGGLLVWAYFFWKGRESPTKHRLFLMTSSAEVQALESEDGDDIGELRSAIEKAMTASN